MSDPACQPTLRQLRYLVALAECGSFTRAASHVGVSQPSFSQAIAQVEEVLGGRVVERGGRAFLTPLGREAVTLARRVLSEAEGFAALALRHRDGELGGTIRLGVSPTLGPYILPQLVARLHATHPRLKVYVREGLPDVLAEQLGDGLHDVLLVQLPVDDARFHVERLFREPMFLAMAADDPLRTVAAIRPEHLAGRGLLTMQPAYRMSTQVAVLAERGGAQVLRDYEGTSLDAVRQMAGMGMGLALLPELYCRQEIRDDGDVIVRPFVGGRPYRDIGLVWRGGAGPSADLMLLAQTLRSIAER